MRGRITLAGEDLLHVRFATTPLLELSAALRTLQTDLAFSPYGEWKARVAAHLDNPSVRTLLPLATPQHIAPDWFGVPDRGQRLSVTLDEQLALLRRLPVRRMRESLDAVGVTPTPEVTAVLEAPVPGERLAEVVAEAFGLLVEPWWSDIDRVVRGDIAHWTDRLASEGLGAVLDDLYERIEWDGRHLTWGPVHTPTDVERSGAGLVLMPTVFGWPQVGVSVRDPWEVALVFPTRSLGSVWDRPAREADDPLADLLGRNRAQVLRLVRIPHSTTTIAQSLDLSPSTVSQHLHVLRASRLVTSYRHGKTVWYRTTELGSRLVDDGGHPSAPSRGETPPPSIPERAD